MKSSWVIIYRKSQFLQCRKELATEWKIAGSRHKQPGVSKILPAVKIISGFEITGSNGQMLPIFINLPRKLFPVAFFCH